MQRTKIEWTDYTWNPIKGICPNDCWYCYARKIYKRFGWDTEMRFELHDPKAIDKLHGKNIPDGSKVFVCSTFELFHPEVPKAWRKDIFDVIKLNPKIIFQILTKFPQNIDRDMPDNVWLGVSITRPSEMTRWTNLYFHQRANLKFVSFEPLLERLDNYPSMLDWIIIGRLTGHGHKYDPEISWIQDIVKDCANQGIKIFLKNNLREIWGEPLIQEFPDES